MRLHLPVFAVFLMMHALLVSAQETPANTVTEKSLRAVDAKYTALTSDINKQSARLLKRMQKGEGRLQKKLALQDSAKAADLFANSANAYQRLEEKLKSPADKTIANPLRDYVDNIDSLKTGLEFLQKVPGMSPDKLQKLEQAGSSLHAMEAQLQKANEINVFIKEREEQLKNALSNSGLVKELKGINAEVFYYQQRIRQYKELLHNPGKLEERIIATVRDVPAFKSFFAKYSYLNQLFGLASNYGAQTTLDGLQTRAQVSSLLTQRISAGGNTNPQQFLQGQMQQAEAQLNELKNKVNQLGGGNSDITMPDFKPNSQHTKSFFQRLEYGINLQSSGSTNLLPAIEDISLSVGYKLSDRASVGVAVGYKLGLGRGWNHIAFSSQGASLRSYFDVKAKGSIWISGGFEYQYLSAFTNFRQIKNLDLWQKVALVGITKKIKIKAKKESDIQLLYNLLYAKNIPRGQPVVFRIGYKL